MTKNILAIAIAAAVAAPSAFAAATVYGVAHMSGNSFSSIKDAAGNSTGLTSISSNSSRLGVKGSEDLSGGMKAVYQMEIGVAMDGNNDAGTASEGFGSKMRNTFVGLNGGFGTVMVGRHDSFIKATGRKYDMFGDGVGNNRNILGGTSGASVNSLVDGRHNNVLAYASPSFGGVSFAVAYVPTSAATGNETLDNAATKQAATTAMVDYTAGPLSATLGYMNVDNAIAGNGFTAYRLGAGYSFGAAKVVALWQNAGVSGTKQDTYGIGASYKVTAAGTVKAQYYTAQDVNSAKVDATLTTVGYDHALSKNTTAYVAYSAAHNNTNATITTDMAGSGSGSNVAAVAGKDNSAFSVGLIHKF